MPKKQSMMLLLKTWFNYFLKINFMLKTTPLLDEVAAQGQAYINDLRQFAQPTSVDAAVLDTLYGLGFNALASQKFQDAWALFSYLLSLKPAEPSYLAGMGHALSGLGDYETACLMHSTAACLNADNAGHYLALADALIELKDLQKADFVLAVAEAGDAQPALIQKMRSKAAAVKVLLSNAT